MHVSTSVQTNPLIIMDSEPKNYEIAYLISPGVAEDQVYGEAGKITGFIQECHGLVSHISEPKSRRLSYPIGKQMAAYFGWTAFTLAPGNLKDLEKKIKSEKDIIRYFITTEVKKPVGHMRPIGRVGQPRPMRESDAEAKPFVAQAPKEEDKVKIEELDKRLEEILGK